MRFNRCHGRSPAAVHSLDDLGWSPAPDESMLVRVSEPGGRRGHLRQVAWQRVSHGLYVPSGTDALHAWQLVLPVSAAFTHLTAAAAYGLWLPPLPRDLPVFARQSNDDPRPRRAGLRITRHTQPVQVREQHGLRLVSAAEALLGCARDLAWLDLVVLVDSALQLAVCTNPELAAAAAERRAGAPRLRLALALCDERSESAWETLLRLLHVVCDIEVEPQYDVFDDGLFVANEISGSPAPACSTSTTAATICGGPGNARISAGAAGS